MAEGLEGAQTAGQHVRILHLLLLLPESGFGASDGDHHANEPIHSLFSRFSLPSRIALETRSIYRSSLRTFCDCLLRPILLKAFSYLPDCSSLFTSLSLTPETIYITAAALKLVIAVMSSDFSGTQGGTDGDEVDLIQLPSDWDTAICNERVLFSFFSLYDTNSLQLAQLSLECILYFTAVRRSLFVSPEQTLSFYHTIIQGMHQILQRNAHLDDGSCHSLFAQCLAKLKTNIQLGELIKFPEFPPFFHLLSLFASNTIQTRGYFNDFPYILLFWSRIVEAIRFSNAPVMSVIPQNQMDEDIDNVVRAFIFTFPSNKQMWENELENPLENLEVLLKYEEKLGIVLCYRYESTLMMITESVKTSLPLLSQFGKWEDNATRDRQMYDTDSDPC